MAWCKPGECIESGAHGGDYFDIGLAMMPVFIRIEKKGTEYIFLYKQDVNEIWISLATYTVTEPVQYVGLQGRTPSAESDLLVAVDYFRLERTNTIGNGDWTPPAPLPTIETNPADSSVTIDYTYDALHRLTEANYSNDNLYQYTYDAVGNRLTQESTISGQSLVSSYQYDIANRLSNVDGVNYTWDANGNLLNDGVNAYTYDYANRLSSVTSGQSFVSNYQYNRLGDRLSQAVNGVTTNYTLDLNTGLTQVLSESAPQGYGTTTYTYGLGRISQQSGTTPEYFLGDALGSVRQMTDPAGTITFGRNYDPYGVVTYTGGTSQTEFGFTGEQYGDSTQLIYLRARYYNPVDGRFQSRDTWSGDYNRPLSLNRWIYVEGNPVNLKDPSGYSPNVDCSEWDWYFKGFCERANGDDNDRFVLDAREQLFYAIAIGGYGNYVKNGGAYGSAGGYAWASMLLLHFLNGSGSKVNIYLGSNDPFVNDPYITRATKRYSPKSTDDEADSITPLLLDFLINDVKPKAKANGDNFKVGPVKLFGSDHYFNRPGKEFGLEPRAFDRGYWAAFGHVTIDGSFSANGYFNCSIQSYLVTYTANYNIEDRYEWFQGKKTPFPFGIGGKNIEVPHEWELSLVNAHRAKMFDFSVSWRESERLSVSSDFDSYTIAPWWMW